MFRVSELVKRTPVDLCDSLCRRDAIRDQALQRAFVLNGWRQT